MSNEQLIIPEGGNYLKGEFVKERGLTELEISDAKNVTFTKTDVEGKTISETKVQVKIKFEGQGEDDPNLWTMNLTSARELLKFFGSTNPKDWYGKIPIETSKSTKGYAVYVDTMRLDKYKQAKL